METLRQRKPAATGKPKNEIITPEKTETASSGQFQTDDEIGKSARLLQIKEIKTKAEKLKVSDTELHGLFFFTPFYFSILRKFPCFGLSLRQKHVKLDRVISPTHTLLSKVCNLHKLTFSAFFCCKLVLVFFILSLISFLFMLWLQANEGDFACVEEIVGADEFLGETSRNPMPCSSCRDLTSVPEAVNISAAEFLEKFAYTGVPLVVRGAATLINSTISFDTFRREYKQNPDALDDIENDCQFFPYNTEFRELREVFKMSRKRSKLMKGEKPWYIGWSSCTEKSLAITDKISSTPKFLPPLDADLRRDWVFIGGAGHGAHIHIDRVSFPSWQAQLSGRKRWTLIPSYECEAVCKTLEVTINTGDVFTLDTNLWFHSTKILPGPMSITIGSEYS